MKRVTLEQDPEQHIDAYFIAHNLPYRTEDVLRLKKMQIGKRNLTIRQQINELGGVPNRNTLLLWHLKLPKV